MVFLFLFCFRNHNLLSPLQWTETCTQNLSSIANIFVLVRAATHIWGYWARSRGHKDVTPWGIKIPDTCGVKTPKDYLQTGLFTSSSIMVLRPCSPTDIWSMPRVLYARAVSFSVVGGMIFDRSVYFRNILDFYVESQTPLKCAFGTQLYPKMHAILNKCLWWKNFLLCLSIANFLDKAIPLTHESRNWPHSNHSLPMKTAALGWVLFSPPLGRIPLSGNHHIGDFFPSPMPCWWRIIIWSKLMW